MHRHRCYFTLLSLSVLCFFLLHTHIHCILRMPVKEEEEEKKTRKREREKKKQTQDCLLTNSHVNTFIYLST